MEKMWLFSDKFKVMTNLEMAYAASINIYGGHWENLTNNGGAKPLNKLHILKGDSLNRGYSEVFCSGTILKIDIINAVVRKNIIHITVPILDVEGHSSLFQMLKISYPKAARKNYNFDYSCSCHCLYLYYKSSMMMFAQFSSIYDPFPKSISSLNEAGSF